MPCSKTRLAILNFGISTKQWLLKLLMDSFERVFSKSLLLLLKLFLYPWRQRWHVICFRIVVMGCFFGKSQLHTSRVQCIENRPVAVTPILMTVSLVFALAGWGRPVVANIFPLSDRPYLLASFSACCFQG